MFGLQAWDALRFSENKPQHGARRSRNRNTLLLKNSLTIRHGDVRPLDPGAPALAREIIETRNPPTQSSHYCRRAFTHRHHQCAGTPLTSPSALPPGAAAPACAGTGRGEGRNERMGFVRVMTRTAHRSLAWVASKDVFSEQKHKVIYFI